MDDIKIMQVPSSRGDWVKLFHSRLNFIHLNNILCTTFLSVSIWCDNLINASSRYEVPGQAEAFIISLSKNLHDSKVNISCKSVY